MRFDETREFDDGGKRASQAYSNALHKLQQASKEIFGEKLKTSGRRPMVRFESALVDLKNRLPQDTDRGKRLLDILDVECGEDIEEALLSWADLDNLSPEQIKRAMYSEFRSQGQGRFDLRPILRRVLDELFNGPTSRRPRVGANRHWPRLLQYLREIEVETNWLPDGQGIRLANKGGRGPVAQYPNDPGRLSVIINPDYL